MPFCLAVLLPLSLRLSTVFTEQSFTGGKRKKERKSSEAPWTGVPSFLFMPTLVLPAHAVGSVILFLSLSFSSFSCLFCWHMHASVYTPAYDGSGSVTGQEEAGSRGTGGGSDFSFLLFFSPLSPSPSSCFFFSVTCFSLKESARLARRFDLWGPSFFLSLSSSFPSLPLPLCTRLPFLFFSPSLALSSLHVHRPSFFFFLSSSSSPTLPPSHGGLMRTKGEQGDQRRGK